MPGVLQILLAHLCARKSERSLADYFWSIAAYTAVNYGALLFGVSQESQLYAFLFTVTTVVWLVAATRYVWRATGRFHSIAVVTGILYGLSLALFGLHWLVDTRLEYFFKIALGTGAWEAFLAVAATRIKSRSGIILSALWFAQASYQYAFILHWNEASETWIEINNWLPAAIVIAGFTAVWIAGDECRKKS